MEELIQVHQYLDNYFDVKTTIEKYNFFHKDRKKYIIVGIENFQKRKDYCQNKFNPINSHLLNSHEKKYINLTAIKNSSH